MSVVFHLLTHQEGATSEELHDFSVLNSDLDLMVVSFKLLFMCVNWNILAIKKSSSLLQHCIKRIVRM